jgi:hypothetical protein
MFFFHYTQIQEEEEEEELKIIITKGPKMELFILLIGMYN